MLLDAYPDAIPEKNYYCQRCKKFVSAIVNDKYCMNCWAIIDPEPKKTHYAFGMGGE